MSENGRVPATPAVHPWRTIDRFESLAERASKFASGPWGTHVGFALIAFWLGAALVVGWTEAYGIVDEFVTMSSFLLLFLLQRAQAKDGLAMQVKLNELLAAVQKASPTLINLEDRPEEEVRAIHDRFQELESRGNHASESIEDVQHA
ncbi:low affinity iron permease family protein [Paludisphaera rhizosphaerae]|uniref:low affinity iron permease family protein n=1 Tax=Paludisphaera rhizosphaerae TaxID=2711216 RepID=UPI0013EAB50D|nr:low affinity iron permease family protein [Paludisphaera rhizosphaerae]